MKDLSKVQETILVEYLQALESGASADDCLARYPEHTEALRPYLELHSRLRTLEAPEPSAAAYTAGREALLARVSGATPTAASRMPVATGGFLAAGWLRSPLARVAAVGVLLVALAGGALGASAAAGVDQARGVFSALHIVPASNGDQQPPQSSGTAESPGKTAGAGGQHSGASASTERPSATPNASVPAANPDGGCVMLPSTSDIVLHPEKHPDWHVGGAECLTPTATPSSSVAITRTPTPPATATPTETSEGSGRDHGRSNREGADLARRTPPKDHN